MTETDWFFLFATLSPSDLGWTADTPAPEEALNVLYGLLAGTARLTEPPPGMADRWAQASGEAFRQQRREETP